MIYNKDNNYNNDHSNNLKTQKNMCFLFTKKKEAELEIISCQNLFMTHIVRYTPQYPRGKDSRYGNKYKRTQKGADFSKTA